ncbi:transcriptional regulator ATRX homolog [Centruroides sculpturatus]|uniref:transcriptional regulator ATRX homolog n=1 Tax=Centruroides sculpturatus TaxID=218467 RepID=UPI000C6DE0E0|nr:transcriptional regulator ATRX homolog [Centruroides sculpturatus]
MPVNIYTDSAATVTKLRNKDTTNPISIDIFAEVAISSNSYAVNWIRGHQGTPGNERADYLARNATLNHTNHHDYVHIPKSKLKSLVWNEAINAWQADWDKISCQHITKRFFPRIQNRMQNKWMQPSHELTQFLTEHGRFRVYLKRFHLIDNDHCNLCGIQDGVLHYLFNCPMLEDIRHRWRQQVNINNMDWPVNPDFLVHNKVNFGLFKELIKLYLIRNKEIENLIVKCTSCGEQINHHNSSYVRRHLHLGVLICCDCFEFYDSGEFSHDETGDIYCRWCAQGGKLIACDYCLNAFCYNCIRRNFGRGEVSCIQDAVKWHCYMCNSQKLNGLVSYCSMILDYSQRMSRKRSPKLSNKFNDKVICINDFSDFDKGTWVQQRIEDVTVIAESLKEQVQLLKTNIDKEKPESVIQCNKVLDRILNKYIKQLRNVVGKQSPFIKDRNSLNFHRQVKIETDVQKTESTVSRRIIEENGFENSYTDNSNSSESSDEKHSKDDENDDDYSLKSNEFHSDTSGETSEVEENAEKLDDKDAKRKNECTELTQSLQTDIHELKSFTSSLNNKTSNSQDLSVYTKKENKDCKTEDEILTDECSNNISNLNNDAFNVTELISSSENISKINNEFNSENSMEIVKSKNDADIPEERSEFIKNDDEKDVENTSDVNSDKIDRDLSHSSCDENDGIDDHNNADKSILSSQENVTNLLLTESNSSIDSEQNVQKEKNDKNLSKQEKLKTENEKIKEKLLADDSSDSETEPFSLPEAISLNKEHFNSDSTTEVSTTQSDSDDSNTSEESKSEYSDHKDDKLQMDVKVRIEKVDDRTLDDTIEDLPMDEQKLEKPEKNSEKNKKDKIADNSLDKEIDRLAMLSTLTTKRKSLISDDDDDDDDDNESENITNLDNGINNDENIDKNEISKKRTQKIKRREIFSSDSEFDSDEQILEKSTDIIEEEKLKLNNVMTKSQNEVAKEMLLRDSLSSSNDDSDKYTPYIKYHSIKHFLFLSTGVKFMWEGTIESLKQLNSTPGSGCILAHCMGLGKTLQVIVFTHTLLTNEFTKKVIRTCLVICPYNTILNWAQEYETWLDEDELKLSVFELASVKDNYRRASCLEEWKEKGGVMIMSYDMFRLLVQENSKRIPKKLKTIFTYTLLDPGPDLVICDEGHILKNESSAVSKATDRIKTRRRVVLTGTPLQNNLSEYHCMVQFVKPHLLGTRKEFLNRFVNPISNGQCADSTPHDVKLMKKRVHILHKLLDGCVQRCDYNSLTSVLPPRHEYVISLKLSDVQVKLYKHFLANLARVRSGTLGTQLFRDCCVLQLICTHPYTLHIDCIRKSNRRFLVDSSDSESGVSFIINDRSLSDIEAEVEADEIVCLDDSKHSTSKKQEKSGNSSEDNSGNEDNEKSSKSKSRDEKKEKREWWSNYIKEEDGTRIDLSGKMVLFFDLLKECELIGDKVLLFSQNLLTLDLIEDLLASITQNRTANSTETVEDVYGSWIHGIDYFRMDGSTNADLRKRWIEIFNDEENTRARLFMISKKAGGLGTNLIGANRVIIMDASWNPSHDIQAIFRVYRFGQKKPVYIYRLLAQGTMEEKIYDRQVTKQSLSCRVVDEQQIERHFNSADLAELYMFNPDSKSKRPTPMVPKDRLLAEMLIKNRDWIVNYHEHDSLLQNISEEGLTEEERQAAWVEYEAEKEGIVQNRAEKEGIVQNSNTASWNVLDPIIQHQPVPTPYQNPETYGPLPDARMDIAKVVENLKLRRPNMAPNEMNSALLSALVMLRAHYQQCHVIAVRQKQDYMARNETAPVQLNEYLSALNVSIQQLTQVLQTIRAQQSQIHQAQQAAAGIRFRNPPWNQNNRMNHLNRANQTQAYKITLTRGTPSQGQSPALGINQNVLQQGPRGPTTINIQLLSNNRVPVITTTSQRLPVNNAPYASSVLRGHAIRLAGNNILLNNNNNNNRTTFRFSTPGNTNVPRFNIGNGVTITPISNPHQSQHNHSFPQDSTQEPVITEAEDCENPVPKIRPQSSHTSSVTITELE